MNSRKKEIKNNYIPFIYASVAILLVVVVIIYPLIANVFNSFQTDTKNILTRETRKAIMRETLVNKNNLSKYISSLKGKGLIVKNAFDGSEINEMFVPEIEDGVVKINFTMGVEDE